MWEGRTRQECQGPHQRECTGNLSTTSWKMKLMARRKDRTIGEKMNSNLRKVEKSKRIKHTTWAHEDDSWNVMCARQTYDLSRACACKQMWKGVKMWRVRCAVHTSRRLQQTAVSCKRSNCNQKKTCRVSLLSSLVMKSHNGSPRSICSSFTSSDAVWLVLHFHELHQESFHCHQDVLDEEDDGCHFWYCQ